MMDFRVPDRPPDGLARPRLAVSLSPAAVAVSSPEAVLDLIVGDQPGPSFVLPVERPTTIGRSSEADIRIADRLTSRLHARVSPEAEGWTITDLGSRNGTRVDGAAVEHAVLRPGAVVGIGTHTLLFRARLPQTTLAAPPGWRVRHACPPAELAAAALSADAASGDHASRFFAALRLLGCPGGAAVPATVVELVLAHCTVAAAAWFPAELTARPVAGAPADHPVMDCLSMGAPGTELRRALGATGLAAWLAPEAPLGGTGSTTGDLICLPVGRAPTALLAVVSTESPARAADVDFVALLATLAGARREAVAEMPGGVPALVAASPDLAFAAWEQALVAEALRRHAGNVVAAARALGISRATLYRRLGAGVAP